MPRGMDFPPKHARPEAEKNPAELSGAERIAAEAEWIKEEARKVYFELADAVKERGISPTDLTESWADAHRKYSQMLGIARKYPEATSPERKHLIDLQRKLMEEFVNSSRISVAEETERVIASRTEPPDTHETLIDGKQEIDATTIHIDTPAERVPEPVEQRAEVSNENTAYKPEEPVAEAPLETKPEGDSIVMVNPVLTKIAMGGKKKKERKSVSEGGTVYKGVVFSEREPWMENKEAQPAEADAGPEPVVIRGAPETRAEFKHILRRSVEKIDDEIEAKKTILKSLEETARHKHGSDADSVERTILSTEDEVRSLEKERHAMDEARNLKGANDTEAAGEPLAEDAQSGVPEAVTAKVQEPVTEPRDFGPDVHDMVAKRAERMAANKKKNRRGIINGFMAAVMATVTGGSAPKPTEAERHHVQPPAAAARQFEHHQVKHWVKTPSTIVSIQRDDQGIDDLMGMLKAELNEMYPPGTRVPNAVTQALMDQDPHDLSVALRFVEGSHAAPMHPRDSLEVNDEGQLIFHDSTKGFDHPQVLMESTFSGVKVKSLYHWAHPHGGKLEHKPVHATHKATVHIAEQANADPDRSTEIAASYARQHADYKQAMESHGFAINTNGPGTYSRMTTETKAVPEAPRVSPAPVERTVPASESAPPHAESKNIHGIVIDKAAAHLYEDANGKFIAYGGSFEGQKKLVDQFLANKENYGKTIVVLTSTPDPLTGQPDVSTYHADATGEVVFVPVVTDENHMPILPPTDDDLVKKLQ